VIADKGKDIMTKRLFIFASEKYQSTYFRIPKVASTSIITTLLKSGFAISKYGDDRDHQGNLTKEATLDKEYDDYFKFAFVRNPWRRLLSAYQNRVLVHNKVIAPGVSNKISFEEFVDIVCAIEGISEEDHIRDQHDYLTLDDKLLVDFVGRIENIQEGWKTVCEKNGMPYAKLHHLKNSSKLYPHHREFYTPELVKKVAKRYAKDIDLFEYKY
jgi:hypothetical protein